MAGRTTCISFHEPAWLRKICLSLYQIKNRYIRKLIRGILLRRRGADMHSVVLREIFKRYHQIDIGLYSYGLFNLNLSPIVGLTAGISVGRYTSVADGLTIINGNHPIRRISSHPFFFNPDCGFVDKRTNTRRNKLIIGNDVYIAVNVTITPSVTNIGDGAVIAAGSVVVKDVPPYAIVGGNPANVIAYRFSHEVIKNIQESRWWVKNIGELKSNEIEFCMFLNDLEENSNII